MAADKYKIGDRVIVVNDWKQSRFRRGPRMNHLLGSIVTITSICERVLEHKERERFYCFAEAFDEGHIWDDSDIVCLAPMLPRPRFELREGKEVILLPHDGSPCSIRPGVIGIITRAHSDHFVVQDKWSLREIAFRKDDFICDDKNESSRIAVYENGAAAKEHQKIVRLQYQIQQMFWQFKHKIPTANELEHIVNYVMQ